MDRDESAAKPEIQANPAAKEEAATPELEPDAEPEIEPVTEEQPEPEVATDPPAAKPRVVDLPPFTPEADFPASPATLSAAFRARKIKPAHAAEVKTLLKQLTALRDSMAARRRNATQPSAKD